MDTQEVRARWGTVAPKGNHNAIPTNQAIQSTEKPVQLRDGVALKVNYAGNLGQVRSASLLLQDPGVKATLVGHTRGHYGWQPIYNNNGQRLREIQNIIRDHKNFLSEDQQQEILEVMYDAPTAQSRRELIRMMKQTTSYKVLRIFQVSVFEHVRNLLTSSWGRYDFAPLWLFDRYAETYDGWSLPPQIYIPPWHDNSRGPYWGYPTPEPPPIPSYPRGGYPTPEPPPIPSYPRGGYPTPEPPSIPSYPRGGNSTREPPPIPSYPRGGNNTPEPPSSFGGGSIGNGGNATAEPPP